MRRYYIMIFLMLVASTAWAQDSTQADVDLKAQMDSLCMDLNTADMSTGLLINKGFSFMNLPGYEGASGCDTIGSILRWEEFYLSLYNAAMAAPTMSEIDSVEKWASDIHDQGYIPIALLNFDYDQLSSTALDDSLIRLVGNRFQDVPGRTSSPYQVHRAFAASAFINELDQNDSARFMIDSRLLFTNRADTISRMEIDFGNGGGFVPVSLNAAVAVAYGTTGTKTIMAKVITTANDTLFAASTLPVKRVTSAGNDLLSSSGNTAGWAVTATRLYEGESTYASGDALILYSNCGNTAMRKPVILVEGFDPTNDIRTLDVWHNYQGFIDNLRDAGYDVVILNFTNGGDHIVKNAYLLEALINRVNTEKELNGSHQELVVIGASMGGLIARYALADMESRSEEHHARLYISFDAPHKGANVPLGVQSMFAALRNYIPPRYRDILSAPATKELLMYHIYDITFGGYCHISLSYTRNALRTALINALNTVGYPTKTRNIALINGTTDRAGQGFNAGDKLVDGYYDTQHWYIPNPHIEIWSVPDRYDGCREIFGLHDFLTVYTRSISGTPPLDNAPGSWWDYHKYVTDFLKTTPVDGRNQHCFIPTVSSLDIASPYSDDLFYDIAGNNVVGTGKTPFATYYAPSVSERHVTLNSTIAGLVLEREIFTDNVYVQNRSMTDVLDFEAKVGLYAGNDVVPSGWSYATGPVTVQSGADVEFVAGSRIVLKPGFSASSGSKFWAHIDVNAPCHPFTPPKPATDFHGVREAETGRSMTSSLAQNFPNPAAAITTIRYVVGAPGAVQLSVTDMLGRSVAILVDNPAHQAGSFNIKYDVSTLRPGVYYYSLRTATSEETREMVVIR
ncbi:MAG: C-terminal target protein [Chlorobi bacterium]|nr:C-terminal target protein [Chlorobiota bacterium]